MHKTSSISTIVLLLTLTPVVVGAQDSTQGRADSAKTKPAAVPPPTTLVIRPDTISLAALHMRLLDPDRRQPDRVSEVAKWIAFGVVGIFFSLAWQRVRQTEKEERSETTLRELMKELAKEPSGAAAIERSLQELVTKFERAAGQITDAGSRADAALGLINARLSHTSERMIEIQQELDRRTHVQPSRRPE